MFTLHPIDDWPVTDAFGGPSWPVGAASFSPKGNSDSILQLSEYVTGYIELIQKQWDSER